MMSKQTTVALVLGVALGLGSNALAQKAKQLIGNPAAQVAFQPLDPKDVAGKGPQMSVVFGDKGKGPVGFLLKTAPGERPGSHTHSSDFYGVVIQGTVHNFAAGGPDCSLRAMLSSSAMLGRSSWPRTTRARR
jgi:hypothetical protein